MSVKRMASLVAAAMVAYTSLQAAEHGDVLPVVLSIAANQAANSEAVQGWPLVVTAAVVHAQAFQDAVTPVTVNAQAGSWANAVHVAVMNAQGGAVTLPLQIVLAPEESLTLDGETYGELAWTVAPANTAALQPGIYTILAWLDSAAVAQPFAELRTVRSRQAEIRVLPAGGALTDAQVSDQNLILAGYHVLRGDDAKALQVVEQLLARQPENVGALFFRAGLLKMAGRLMDAFDAYSSTLDAYYKASDPDPANPPSEILREFLEVRNEIEQLKTFDVSTASKTGAHPYHQKGHDKGFVIEGVEGAELWLARDSTYTFKMTGVPAEDGFYISTSPVGHGDGVFASGVSGQPASGTGELNFTPGDDAPELLYYQSMSHDNMGWRLHIHKMNTTTSVEEDRPETAMPGEYRLTVAYPNPFNPQTRLDLSVRQTQRITVKALDILGRQVGLLFDDQLGAFKHQQIVFDGNALPSGSYVVYVKGEHFSETRRVMLLK